MDLEWDPWDLLDIYPGGSCVGTRKKDGERCLQSMIAKDDIDEANRILTTLRRSDYTARGFLDWVNPQLERLAEVTLCPRWHRKPSHSQVDIMRLKWYNIIRDLRHIAQRRNRRRGPPEEQAIRMLAAPNPDDYQPGLRRRITYFPSPSPSPSRSPSPSPSRSSSSSSSSSPSSRQSPSPNRSPGPRTSRNRTPESNENTPPQSPRSSYQERESRESQRRRQSQRQSQTQTPPIELATPPRQSQASTPTPNTPSLETLCSTIATLSTVLTTFQQNNIATAPIEEAIATAAASITNLLGNNPSSPSGIRSNPRSRTSVRPSDSVSSHTLGRTPDRSISSRTLSRRSTEV